MPRGNPGVFRLRHPKWFDDVKVGDVIAKPHGQWRVVREVSRRPNGTLYCVYLAIRRCSWTGRCYTILNFTDLRTFKYRRISGAAIRLKSRGIDAKIRRALHEPAGVKSLTCCDVIGWVP
jgi:hypothetical protein